MNASWHRILAPGIKQHDDGTTYVFDDEAFDSIINNFDPTDMPLVDVDHMQNKGHTVPPAGRVIALRKGTDGLYARIRWTPDGWSAVTSRRYQWFSPGLRAWPASNDPSETRYRPALLRELSLSNRPALPELRIFMNDEFLSGPSSRVGGATDHRRLLCRHLGIPENCGEKVLRDALKRRKMKNSGGTVPVNTGGMSMFGTSESSQPGSWVGSSTPSNPGDWAGTRSAWLNRNDYSDNVDYELELKNALELDPNATDSEVAQRLGLPSDSEIDYAGYYKELLKLPRSANDWDVRRAQDRLQHCPRGTLANRAREIRFRRWGIPLKNRNTSSLAWQPWTSGNPVVLSVDKSNPKPMANMARQLARTRTPRQLRCLANQYQDGSDMREMLTKFADAAEKQAKAKTV